jgi:hypothetical protein
VLTLPDGATVSQNGLVVSTTDWTLTMTPGTGSASPTFVCSTDLPPGFVVGPNGHAYAFVAAPGISHAAALGAAATYSAAGGQVGHLATLTDAAEHSFAFSLVGSRSAWLGGSDSAVEGTWLWVTGPEAGTVFANGVAPVGGSYVNWQNGQPDNANEEDCLHFRIGMPNRWNDAPCEWSANAGYVVEISL